MYRTATDRPKLPRSYSHRRRRRLCRLAAQKLDGIVEWDYLQIPASTAPTGDKENLPETSQDLLPLKLQPRTGRGMPTERKRRSPSVIASPAVVQAKKPKVALPSLPLAEDQLPWIGKEGPSLHVQAFASWIRGLSPTESEHGSKMERRQVEAVGSLLESGATAPYIIRYAQRVTQGANEMQVVDLQKAWDLFVVVGKAREKAMRLMKKHHVPITAAMRSAFDATASVRDVDELSAIYLPSDALERSKEASKEKLMLSPANEALIEMLWQYVKFPGSEPPSHHLLQQRLEESFQNCKKGRREWRIETVVWEQLLRRLYRTPFMTAIDKEVLATGQMTSTAKRKDKTTTEHAKSQHHQKYHDWKCPLSRLKGYDILALYRGKDNGTLSLRVELYPPALRRFVSMSLFWWPPMGGEYRLVARAFAQFIDFLQLESRTASFPRTLLRHAEKHLLEQGKQLALSVFESNVLSQLRQPAHAPLPILALDPGTHTAKTAMLNSRGIYQAGSGQQLRLFPQGSPAAIAGFQQLLSQLIQCGEEEGHQTGLIVVGNGKGAQAVEEMARQQVAHFQKEHFHSSRGTASWAGHFEFLFHIVDEAGASVYSVSEEGRAELGGLDPLIRSAISLGRRVLAPAAELVKIPPAALGSAFYPHDMKEKDLEAVLAHGMSTVISLEGVDLNQCSLPQLRRVSGLTVRLAESILAWRSKHGCFEEKQQLLQVEGIGPGIFAMCAGFLRIQGGREPLDATALHPTEYPRVKELQQKFPQDMDNYARMEEHAGAIWGSEGEEMVRRWFHISAARGKAFPYRSLLTTHTLGKLSPHQAMERRKRLEGIVRNIVPYGLFVDVGGPTDGLLHSSHLSQASSQRFGKKQFAVGDKVTVYIREISGDKGNGTPRRMSLAEFTSS